MGGQHRGGFGQAIADKDIYTNDFEESIQFQAEAAAAVDDLFKTIANALANGAIDQAIAQLVSGSQGQHLSPRLQSPSGRRFGMVEAQPLHDAPILDVTPTEAEGRFCQTLAIGRLLPDLFIDTVLNRLQQARYGNEILGLVVL